MSSGSLTMACLLLLSGQTPADEVYFNRRAMKIPIDTPPGVRRQVKEFVLYVSANRGQSWERYGSELPDKEFFVFRAPKDGDYWFRIAAINAQGKQDPENLYAGPPQQKVKIDTVHKPELRIVSARRSGEELVVTWEARAPVIPPDPTSMKLEYRMLDGSSTVWFPIPLTPNETGVARTRLFGPGRVAVQMQFRDVAGNLAKVEGVEVPAADGATNVATAGSVSPNVPPAPDSVRPVNHTPDVLPSPSTALTPPKAADPPTVAQTTNGPAGTQAPVSLPNPPAPAGTHPEPAPGLLQAPGGTDREVPVASTTQRAPMPAPPGPASAEARPARPAPLMQLVNTREVTLEYQLAKLGPSGVGSVILYMTSDGGRTWAAFKDEKPPDKTQPVVGNKYQRVLNLPPGERVYGLILGVRNGGNLGRPEPRAGETPEMVIEVDLTPPEAKLWGPQPDPARSDAVVLKWSASDKNLADHPVTLEWAKQLQGPWQLIASDLEGAGSYSWKVPPEIPVQVHLRLRVRDKAGNEGVAITNDPQTIDLVEPEGHLVGVRAVSRH